MRYERVDSELKSWKGYANVEQVWTLKLFIEIHPLETREKAYSSSEVN